MLLKEFSPEKEDEAALLAGVYVLLFF
jgi:hypothetical protein